MRNKNLYIHKNSDCIPRTPVFILKHEVIIFVHTESHTLQETLNPFVIIFYDFLETHSEHTFLIMKAKQDCYFKKKITLYGMIGVFFPLVMKTNVSNCLSWGCG